MNRRRRPATGPRLECLDERLLLSTVTPAQVDSAYGLNAITFSRGTIKGNGAGQTIAIVDAYHDPSIYGDLAAFDARNNLPTPPISTALPANASSPTARPTFDLVNFAGYSTNSLWNMEEALDVEMAHAAAPAANLVLVEARTPGIDDFISAINAVKTLPSVSVISMSWGGPEFDGEQSFDKTFTTPLGHIGITYVASSGDDGAGAEWPAASPNVVGIGGTSLVVASTGARVGESAWYGSGGAVSQFESKPGYQAKAVQGTMRSSPDVAAVADPGTGVVINSWGSAMQVGGTSMSAPIWAGLFALADQGLVAAGKSSLDGPTQALPDLYKAPAGSFFDITSGSRASTGYDTSTGLGTPNGLSLIGYLDGSPTTTTTTTTTTTGTTGTTGTHLGTSLAVPGPTSPTSLPLVVSSTDRPSFMANLVALPPADPAATDAALAAWGSARPAASSRWKTRG